MWETFISWYINNYLGQYVENLNAQQLSFALSQGELELENVPLKKNIFRSWGLPVEVKVGLVGRIKIEFNIFKYLRNEPVLISIEDIYLVAGPLNLSEWDHLEEEALAHDAKMSALDSHEARWKAQYDLSSDSSSYYSSLYVSSTRIGASIVTKVVENLQLNVNNVHIRFEQQLENSNRTIAIGVTLRSLNVQSCDANWHPLSSSTSVSGSSFKILKLSKLGIYCDTNSQKMSTAKHDELKELMEKTISHSVYLLSPVSAEARIVKNNSNNPLTSVNKPRFDIHLTLDKVPLQLADKQYKHGYNLYTSFKKLSRNCRLRHYRPFRKVSDNVADWWIYATQAVLALRGFKRRKKLKTWELVIARARDNVEYVSVYQKYLLTEILSFDETKLKDRFEFELHYEDILELRKIAMDRVEKYQGRFHKPETKLQAQKPQTETKDATLKPATSGVLSWMFPSWSGWTKDISNDVNPQIFNSSTTDVTSRISESTLKQDVDAEFEEAILDDVKAFGRDALLARFNFTLHQGVVFLNKQNVPFLELDFGGVAVELCLKPRSGSHKFQMSLAHLLLRDCSTKSSILASHVPNPVKVKPSFNPDSSAVIGPLFQLLYEAKPQKRTGHRIVVTTKPMDLILYPLVWEDMRNFFHLKEDCDFIEIPYNGYEAMKQKTKEELKVYWERLMLQRATDETNSGDSSWEIYMDIFAPQIIIYGSNMTKHPVPATAKASSQSRSQEPFRYQNRSGRQIEMEKYTHKDSFVVIDLGRFRFTNLECINGITSPELLYKYGDTEATDDSISDDDEEFLTPCSSPVPEALMSDPLSPRLSRSLDDICLASQRNQGIDCIGDSLIEIHSKLYKKYTLEITDVQVVVVDGNSAREGQWKAVNVRGTSFLHLVDRLSINLQVERRLVYSEDPLWPALTLVGTLPKLTFHLNESKLLTVTSVLDAFTSKDLSVSSDKFDVSFMNGSQINLSEFDKSIYKSKGADAGNKTGVSKLFVAEFTIQNVSIDLQSRGRNIAELQILGTRTVLTRREEDTEFSFVIQSLLLADAVQTFGPDFQLLVASHRHVCMDTFSGSIKDSEPTSPISPVSPPSPLPCSKSSGSTLSIPSQLHEALVSSLRAKKLISSIGLDTPMNVIDSGALITADVVFTRKEEDIVIITLQFNNLDIIANQETIVEIIQFLHTVFPNKSDKISQRDKDPADLVSSSGGRKLQANFEFHRLNVLLLRGVVGKDGHQVARKIATATASEARVNCTLNTEGLNVDGSLGGLQVLNLTPEGQYHQRVVSVGQDPLIDTSYPWASEINSTETPFIYPSDNESALTFSYTKPVTIEGDQASPPTVTLKMASVIYTHCSMLLMDLKKCINQFQAPLATSLKSAATQIALGLVRQDTASSHSYRSPSASLSGSLDHLDMDEGPSIIDPYEKIHGSRNMIKLDVVLDSPIIVLPRSRNSPEVLVAHLGQINITGSNQKQADDITVDQGDARFSRSSTPEKGFDGENPVSYSVFICDISLYSLNLKTRWRMIENLKMTYPSTNYATAMKAQDLYRCDSSSALPILHNTVIQFNLFYFNEGSDDTFGYNDHCDADQFGYNAVLEVKGRVINALKVSLTPQQYSQLLDSINNLTSITNDELDIINLEEKRVQWEKETRQFKKKASVPAPLPSPTMSFEDILLIYSLFEVPELIVELVLPKLGLREVDDSPHLSLSCSELSFKCDRKQHATEMDICLKALTLEDTNAELESWRRVLAISKVREREECLSKSGYSASAFLHSEHISKSCPDILKSAPIHVPSAITRESLTNESSSLPTDLEPEDIFRKRCLQAGIKPKKSFRKRRNTSFRLSSSITTHEFCPVTPPPSPRAEQRTMDNLVQIKIVLVDSKSPYFVTTYGGNHKNVTVDFNTLDVLLTPDTFSSLRKFFADASKDKISSDAFHDLKSEMSFSSDETGHIINDLRHSAHQSQDERNTETLIKVKALKVKLASSKGLLAEAEVSDVRCDLKSRGQEYFGVEGRLGSLKVKDISPFAGLYPLKFAFQGMQALDFDYSRTGVDGRFRLNMSSILCVHTNRFYAEFTTLWSSLFGEPPTDLHDLTHLELVEPDEPDATKSTKIIVDIQAGAPVILFPYSSNSNKIIVSDLGHLSVRNKFVEDSETLIINRISVDLMEMDLYSGELVQESEASGGKAWRLHKGWAVIRTRGDSSFLKKQCALNLKVRKIFKGSLNDGSAAIRVQGVLSTVYCTIDPEKYKLIRGFLAHNIAEQIDSVPSAPVLNTETIGPKLSKKTSNVESSKLELTVELDLVNVTLDVLLKDGAKLSRVDFIRSKFTFQSSSDGTKDVDLASQEILISDSRFEGHKGSTTQGTSIDSETESDVTNVFTNILQQCVSNPQPSSNSFASSSHTQTTSFHSDVPLQAEVHFRQNQRGSNVTIVLNNMRLMLILDWWMEVRSFLSQEIPKPPRSHRVSYAEENLHSFSQRPNSASPLLERSRDLCSPVTVSAGIVTKRAPVLNVPETSFELKINISSCELVVVEKAAFWDTNAIILKSTAVMGYRPHLERPISCSLIECELFSCILGLESETALSILDPTSIQIELIRQAKSGPQGILDATFSLASSGKILKLQSPTLSLRLSYHDMKMFVRLMDKFSKDAQSHIRRTETNEAIPLAREPSSSLITTENDESIDEYLGIPFVDLDLSDADTLTSMGFSRNAAIAALSRNLGSLENAIFSLTKSEDISNQERPDNNVRIANNYDEACDEKMHSTTPESAGHDLGFLSGIEARCNCLSVCVIDDCKDSDVPLLEFSVQQLELSQNCVDYSGSAECVLSGDYYNRTLSGWEPFLEPWKCTTKWQKNLLGQLDDSSSATDFPSRAPEMEISLSSRMIMEVNVTSTLLGLYKTVFSNWAEDYEQVKIDKRRTPFVPFAIKNETGSALWFCTILSNNEELIKQQKAGGNYFSDGTGWIEVSHGAVQHFSFEGRGKLRHRNTHQLRTHQLAVRVDGWKEVTPVSVDRVGTYFRVAKPEATLRRYSTCMELPPTRLVFEVSLQGAAQKLVIVRSALMVKNMLPEPVELKLENTIVYPSFEKAQTGGSYIVQVQHGQTYPIPLHSVWAHMWIRPIIPDTYPLTYLYCSKALLIGNSQEGLRECVPRAPEQALPYRFCVAVKRNEFPADSDDIIPHNSLPNIVQLMSVTKRANLVTLFSPFKIMNLLPHEINFEIRGNEISGRIAPGKDCTMTNIDTTVTFEVAFQVDNFPQGTSVTYNPTSSSAVLRLRMQDGLKRTLVLSAKVQREDCGVVVILLSCPCWVVNKSGLPLLCKQDGTNTEAAGQFQEHEVGRMVTPLMMSFADQEGSADTLTLRVGTGLHKNSKPFWCRTFACQNGIRVRKLTVGHGSNRPESVYMVGIEVKNGIGRYRDTKLVVVSPRYIVDNRSSFKIQISQRAYATSFFDAKAEATHLSLPAGCNLPFHWPRLDKEQFLCVRLKEQEGSSWSGGFPIDNVDSFHINIRDKDGGSQFLRVEIVLQGPSYFVIFSDTIQLPPPFRVDNFSLVPIVFHQTCIGEERLKISARSEASLPYVMDEPSQPPHITVAAPGGNSVIVNMDELRYLTHLTYDNFFYIAFSATFMGLEESIGGTGMETLQLVLDVPEGTKVVLSKKEQGKRSQLWRINEDGLIEHEGSSSPRDPRKPVVEGNMLVLDIAGSAPLPNQCVPLMLRKADKRRASTQHWEFTHDGQMKCRMYEGVYVQAKDGFGTSANSANESSNVGSWQEWRDVVLGPSQPICYIRTASGIQAEQAVASQKLRPGSGTLTLSVETDGPTRVLRVIDLDHPPRRQLLNHTYIENDCNTTPKFRLKLDLYGGLGISIVSCNPREELLYARFSGVFLEWTDTKNSQIVKASVLNLQIDNQLLDAEKSAAIYVPSGIRSESVNDFDLFQEQPALHLYWESMKSNLNARVFKIWELVIKPITLVIDEKLLLKMCIWLGFGKKVQSLDALQQSDFEVQKALTSNASVSTRRYYFGILKLVLNQVKLSVLTSSKLQPELAAVKRRLGLTLIRFEDANVELDPFEKHHPFETFEFLWALIVKHYKDELLSQAAVILGSTDFLGNPLGFVNDVSEGVSLMIYEGSVGALVKNVAHGLSNSAAKVTGTLGEGLGRTILDDKHEEERRRIKEDHAGSSGEYLYAGLRGFGHGLIGGVTSVVTQSYEGMATEGFSGLFTGLSRGIVGTITKPAVGVLDFATGAASAIRDSSKTSSRIAPTRSRLPRVVVGNGGLLPIFLELSAKGQELLFELNDRNYSEIFIGCETLKSGPNQDLRIMISSQAVTVFRPGKGNPFILKVPLSDLTECQIAAVPGSYERNPYIELVRRLPDTQAPSRPQVVCEHENIAKRVVQQVNYAKVLYEEMRHSQIGSSSLTEE